MADKKIFKNRGVSLIALIITILVMVILAAVVYRFAAGDTGVINNAQNASKKNEIATIEERIKSSYVYDTQTGEIDLKATRKAIKETLKSLGYENVKVGNSFPILVSANGTQFKVSQNGNVTISGGGGEGPRVPDPIPENNDLGISISWGGYYNIEGYEGSKHAFQMYSLRLSPAALGITTNDKNASTILENEVDAEETFLAQINTTFSMDKALRNLFAYMLNEYDLVGEGKYIVFDSENDKYILGDTSNINDDVSLYLLRLLAKYKNDTYKCDKINSVINNVPKFSSFDSVFAYLKGKEDVNGTQMSRLEIIIRYDSLASAFAQAEMGDMDSGSGSSSESSSSSSFVMPNPNEFDLGSLLDAPIEGIDIKGILDDFVAQKSNDIEDVAEYCIRTYFSLMGDDQSGSGSGSGSGSPMDVDEIINDLDIQAYIDMGAQEFVSMLATGVDYFDMARLDNKVIPSDSGSKSATEYIEDFIKLISPNTSNFTTLENTYIKAIQDVIDNWKNSKTVAIANEISSVLGNDIENYVIKIYDEDKKNLVLELNVSDMSLEKEFATVDGYSTDFIGMYCKDSKFILTDLLKYDGVHDDPSYYKLIVEIYENSEAETPIATVGPRSMSEFTSVYNNLGK